MVDFEKEIPKIFKYLNQSVLDSETFINCLMPSLHPDDIPDQLLIVLEEHNYISLHINDALHIKLGDFFRAIEIHENGFKFILNCPLDLFMKPEKCIHCDDYRAGYCINEMPPLNAEITRPYPGENVVI